MSKAATNTSAATLNRTGLRYGTYVWDPAYKGLDDFVAAGNVK